MDTKREIYSLPIHKHPLFPTVRIILRECDGCHVTDVIYGGYFCNERNCYGWFHKECAEAPPEINHHPSHSDHPLLLTNDTKSRDSSCDCCGENLLSPCYTCPTCKFKVDLVCGMKPPRPAIEHPVCHDHPLVFLKKQEVEVPCEACKESIGGASYSCLECHVYFHLDCVHLSKEVNHPCHPSHPLKVVAFDPLDVQKSCHFCLVQPENVMYHCSICNFTMCFSCIKNPPPLVVEDIKTHNHPLKLFSNQISFICKFCGFEGSDTKPYICFTCNFVVHGKCIGLPRVIKINRHDHRISFTYHHGHRGRTECGVCGGMVGLYNGAYCCSACANYTVHPGCATDLSVWNGVELEGIPEWTEDVAPFELAGHNLIRHFSHSKHALRFLEDKAIQYDECIRCEACIRPLGFDPIYSCTECCFVLHEMCAKLPTKRRLVFDPEPYTLESYNAAVYCNLCEMLCDGFKYKSNGTMPCHYIDVHCGSLSEPFVHNVHSHCLYFAKSNVRYCDACSRTPNDYMLSCRECDFDLCLYCVKLPEKILHMSDEHPLILYYGEKWNGGCGGTRNWCDVCESELDPPSNWLYACSDCEVALHVQCALGDFSRLKPEHVYLSKKGDYKVVYNNRYTRPFCSQCHSRCKAPLILKDNGKDNGYICSFSCFSELFGYKICELQRTEM
ncbi:hypothetical protein N665_3834s0003 [Sinapis alba]|nr:hypothetical protein N665_3834s0003 [Sinapis alba]